MIGIQVKGILVKKTEIVENESEKDEDSAIKVSKEEYTPYS